MQSNLTSSNPPRLLCGLCELNKDVDLGYTLNPLGKPFKTLVLNFQPWRIWLNRSVCRVCKTLQVTATVTTKTYRLTWTMENNPHTSWLKPTATVTKGYLHQSQCPALLFEWHFLPPSTQLNASGKWRLLTRQNRKSCPLTCTPLFWGCKQNRSAVLEKASRG